MARVFEVSFKLAAQMAGNFSKTMTAAATSLRGLDESMDRLSQNRAANQQLIDLRRTVAESSREYIQAKQRVAELGRQLAQTENPTRAMKNEFKAAELAVKKAKDELNTQRQTLRQLNTEMGTTNTRTADLVRRQQELARASDKAQAAHEKMQKTMAAQEANMQKRGDMRGQLFDAAALAVSMAAPIKAAIQFESAMADVNKVVDQTAQQSQEMSKEILEMSRTIPMGASALAQIVAAGGQSGIARQDLLKFTETAAKMGVAFDISADEAGQAMAELRSAFKLNQTQVTTLADQINYLGNTTPAAAKNILEIVQRIGPLGEVGGYASSSIAALGATLRGMGVQNEIAATGIKNMMLALVAGESATKGQIGAYEELGLSYSQVAKDMQKDANGTTLMVLEKIASLEKYKQAAVMSDLFGKESLGAIAPLLTNMSALENNLKAVGNATLYAGSMQKEFASRSATTENNLQLLRNKVSALGITAGTVLLPGINMAADALGKAANIAADFAEKYPNLTKAIVFGTTALIALKVATIAGGFAFTFLKGGVLSLVGVVNTARTAWLLYRGAIVATSTTSKAAVVASKTLAAAQLAGAGVVKIVTAAWRVFNLVLRANPIGLVITAIGALVAAGIYLYRNWDTVKAKAAALWSSMKSIFRNGMNTIKSWLNSFSLFDSGRKLLQTLANGIKSAVSVPVNAIKGALSKVRRYLPFSDAKEGPLSQLTASGMAIMQTLSQGMAKVNTNQMMQPFSRTSGNMLGQMQGGTLDAAVGRISGASAGGGGIVLHLTQEITVNGGTGGNVREQARQGASQGANDLMKALERLKQQEARLNW